MTPNAPPGEDDDRPGETPPDLVARAEAAPERVDLEAVFAALSSDDAERRREGATALLAVADGAPRRLAGRADALAELLRSGREEVRRAATVAVRDAARANPSGMDGLVAPLRRRLGDQDREEAGLTGEALAALLEPDGDALAATVEDAADLLRERGDAEHGEIVRVLTALGTAVPAPVVTTVRPLVDADDPAVVANATRILSLVAEAEPSAVEAVVPDAVDLLVEGDERAAGHAVELLAAVADADPGRVAGEVHALADVLDAERPSTRRAAAGGLASLARADPDAVAPAVPALVDRLGDPDRIVRRDAAYVLGVVRAEEARDSLEALREGGSPELTAVAERSLARLDGDTADPPLADLEPGEVFRRGRGSPADDATRARRDAVRERRRRERRDAAEGDGDAAGDGSEDDAGDETADDGTDGGGGESDPS